MAMTDTQVAQWLAEYDAGLEADVERAERGWSAPPVEPQPSLALTGGTLVPVPCNGEAPEPWPGEAGPKLVAGPGQSVPRSRRLRAYRRSPCSLNRIWTGPRTTRARGASMVSGRAGLTELRGELRQWALSYAQCATKRAISGLVAKGHH